MSLSDLDPKTKVVDLTLEQLLEATNFAKLTEKAQNLIQEYEGRLRELKEVEKQSATIFNNVKNLTAATTPFEVATQADLEKLTQTIKQALGSKQIVVLAMAFKEGP